MAIANNNPENQNEARENKRSLTNNSGRGPNSPVLDIVAKKFNWGAFCLQWIWGLGNNTFITLIVFLLCCIPVVQYIAPLGCAIWFGIKGNEWAWQNKRWESIEHFHSVQKKWAIAGIIYTCIITILALAICITTLFALKKSFTNVSIKQDITVEETVEVEQELPDLTILKKAVNTLKESSYGNKLVERTCDGTSEDLSDYFAEVINNATQNDTSVETSFGVYTFEGDGACFEPGDCSVTFTDNRSTNETIPLSIDDEGYVVIHADEVMEKYEH